MPPGRLRPELVAQRCARLDGRKGAGAAVALKLPGPAVQRRALSEQRGVAAGAGSLEAPEGRQQGWGTPTQGREVEVTGSRPAEVQEPQGVPSGPRHPGDGAARAVTVPAPGGSQPCFPCP